VLYLKVVYGMPLKPEKYGYTNVEEMLLDLDFLQINEAFSEVADCAQKIVTLLDGDGEPAISAIPLVDFPPSADGYHEVFVLTGFLDSPDDFWVQLRTKETYETMEKMGKDMYEFYEKGEGKRFQLGASFIVSGRLVAIKVSQHDR